MTRSVLIYFLLIATCISAQENVADNSGSQEPLVTGFGKPIGKVITKEIGPAGGSISSEDGMFKLMIPEGAVATLTTITLQSVTNTMSADSGPAYKLLPENIKFLKPVVIDIRYVDDSLHPETERSIAFQDEKGNWKVHKTPQIDTITNTVRVTTEHFSTWVMFRDNFLIPQSAIMKTSTKRAFVILNTCHGGCEDLEEGNYTAVTVHYFRLEKDIIWRVNGIVNGNDQVGKIIWSSTPTAAAYFQAPAKIPQQNPVAVSAEFTYKHLRGQKKILVSHVKIVDNGYLVTFASRNYDGNTKIVDSSSCVAHIVGQSVYITDIINYPPEIFTKNKCNQFINPEMCFGPVQMAGLRRGTYFPAKENSRASALLEFAPVITWTPSFRATCARPVQIIPSYFFTAAPPVIWFAIEGDNAYVRGEGESWHLNEVRGGNDDNGFVIRVKKL